MILYIATSLDGFIAMKDGNVDWLFHDQDYGYKKFLQTIDTIVFGRNTYEQVLTFGDWPYSDLKTFVFTHQKLEDRNNVEFISSSVIDTIAQIRKQSNKNIWLVGGENIITQYANNNLIDEFILFLHPIYLGSGIPLLKKSVEMNPIKFTKTKSYKSGIVEIHLQKEKKR